MVIKDNQIADIIRIPKKNDYTKSNLYVIESNVFRQDQLWTDRYHSANKTHFETGKKFNNIRGFNNINRIYHNF